MKKICRCMLVVAGAFAMSACSVEDATEEYYVKLSDAEVTFTEDGNGTHQVGVKANPGPFEAVPGADWVKITEQTDKTFTIAVDPNGGDERSAVIKVKAGEMERRIKVKQLGRSGMNGRVRIMKEWKNAVISPNGRYLGGAYFDIAKDDSFIYTAVIRDLETDIQKEFGPYPVSLFSMSEAHCMSDKGLLFVGTNSGGLGTIGFEIDDEDYFLPNRVPECDSAPVIYKTSSDGSVWVGYVSSNPYKVAYAPVKWVNGTAKLLPLPEKNFRYEDFWAGIMARGMSSDGSIVYGTTWEDYDFGMVYWDEKDEVRYVGEDVHEIVETVTLENGLGEPYEYNLTNGMICWANKDQISPNGKWIAGTYRTEALSDKQDVIQAYYPAFYNTQTRKTTIFRDMGGFIGMGATDDGIGFVGNSTMGVTGGCMVDIENGTEISDMNSWIQDTYGIVSPGGFIQAISQDGEVVLGKLPLVTAAGVVYVNYYIAPPLD